MCLLFACPFTVVSLLLPLSLYSFTSLSMSFPPTLLLSSSWSLLSIVEGNNIEYQLAFQTKRKRMTWRGRNCQNLTAPPLWFMTPQFNYTVACHHHAAPCCLSHSNHIIHYNKANITSLSLLALSFVNEKIVWIIMMDLSVTTAVPPTKNMLIRTTVLLTVYCSWLYCTGNPHWVWFMTDKGVWLGRILTN